MQQRLGQFWLAWRTDRGEWAICWNDSAAGTRRRKSTGVRDHNGGSPPSEAQQSLADHFRRHGKPEEIDPNAATSVSRLMSTWLLREGATKARAEAYTYAVAHLNRWIDNGGPRRVSEVNAVTTQDYILMRQREGISGATISSELAALSRALRWGEMNGVLSFAPRIATVAAKDKPGPKEIEYSPRQVAALLDAATARLDRLHVAIFAMIMLSTHARVEAALEGFAEQHKSGLLYTNEPGRAQTTKRRSVVPVVPTLEPWLPSSGKLIVYRAWRKDGTLLERPTYSIKNAFAGCRDDAGIAQGSPNTLRHTIHTYLQTKGVPQAQIDAAAGHVSERGSGRNYTHLRPDYLREFKAAVEDYWREMDAFTSAHRSQLGPKDYCPKTGLRL